MRRSIFVSVLSATFAIGTAFAQLSAPKIIILVGPPGSGKTTMAGILSKKYGIPAFSMAELLKKEMGSHRRDIISKSTASAVASGEMLPDDAAANLIKIRIFRSDVLKGFILDGYPATAGQAKALDQMFQENQMPKAVVIVLDAPDEVIRKRMLGRRRVDDKPENIDRRIQEFRTEAALLAGWAGRTRVVRVNATRTLTQISAEILAGLDEAWQPEKFQERPKN
jgi:adenylate kinase